ncbi:hypothetical protein Lalb_Chr25g0280871 [Lupinus albus]|uniref:Uncharacterized protein n=1 Tax=Lupinus albus TaxID=3870 RepID=A0A6A4NDG4_LUPAL|nr:hypothetical protein Lalb_Chr25g0280871 [Lupinus albus]
MTSKELNHQSIQYGKSLALGQQYRGFIITYKVCLDAFGGLCMVFQLLVFDSGTIRQNVEPICFL